MAGESTQGRAFDLRRAAAYLETFLLLGGFVAYLYWRHPGYWGDGVDRGNAIMDLMEKGRLTPMKYSYVGPLFSIPIYILDKLFHSNHRFFFRYNYFVFATAAAVAYFTLRKRIDPAHLRRFFLLVLAASMFPYHIRTFYGEMFSAVFAAVGILLVTYGRPVWGWSLLSLAVLNTPALAVGMALVCVATAWTERKWQHLLPLLAVAAGILLESWIVRGHPLVSGYENDGAGPPGIRPYAGLGGFSFPLFLGALSILFSFGRGILFYAPGLWLAFQRPKCEPKLHRTYVLWMLFLLGEILVYSRWNNWHGATYWGPRFFLFASIPACYLLVIRLANREENLVGNLLTLVVLVASAWVGLNGAIFHLKTLSEEFCNQVEGVLCLYVPEFSPLWQPFLKVPPLTTADWKVASYCAVAFTVLAAPLVSRIVRQAGARARAAIAVVKAS